MKKKKKTQKDSVQSPKENHNCPSVNIPEEAGKAQKMI
jgi:hypothetical protein